MDKQRNWTGWVLIAAIIIISGAALAVNTLAGDQASAPADPARQQHESVLRQLFPNAGEDADSLERMDQDGEGFVYTIRQGGGVIGYAVQQTVSGYAGPFEVTAGFLPDYTLAGIHVGGETFQETEGLGAKAKDESFTSQFKGAHLPIKLGETIDAIAGATVTSQAVTDGVNAAAQRLWGMPGMVQPPSVSPVQDNRTANASVMGYGGPVLVRLTLDEAGAVAALDVGGARFQETEGVGSRVKEASFAQAFIGQTPPLTLNEDIDALSGATISSQAVVEAVNAAHTFLTQKQDASDTK